MNFVYWLVVLVLLAGCVWLWLLYRREKGKRWDEISRAEGLEKELEVRKAREICTAQSVLWYAEQLKREKVITETWVSDCKRLLKQVKDLQDFKSSVICPTNGHIWQDGVCKKCGVKK